LSESEAGRYKIVCNWWFNCVCEAD